MSTTGWIRPRQAFAHTHAHARAWARSAARALGAALAGLVLAAAAQGEPISASDAKALTEQVRALGSAYENGDAAVVVARTYPPMMQVYGGPDAFRAMTQSAMEKSRGMGVMYERQDVRAPDRLYDAGDEWVAFVPRVSVLRMGQKRAQSHGFMIAVRPKRGGAWKFIDGAVMRKNPDLLRQLFPKLEPTVSLPRNEVVRLTG